MNRYSHRKSRNAGSGWLLTTHELANHRKSGNQVTILIDDRDSRSLDYLYPSAYGDYDNSCDGCNFLLLALSSMKVMHLSTYVMV